MDKWSQTKTSSVILPKLPEKTPSLSNDRGIGETNPNELKKSAIFGQIKKEIEKTKKEAQIFSCSHCNKKFSYPQNVQRHQRIHTGEKPFACSYCDKKFRRSEDKIAHEMTHAGEKPFNCSYCDREFVRLDRKIIHEKTHSCEKPLATFDSDKKFITSKKKKCS